MGRDMMRRRSAEIGRAQSWARKDVVQAQGVKTLRREIEGEGDVQLPSFDEEKTVERWRSASTSTGDVNPVDEPTFTYTTPRYT